AAPHLLPSFPTRRSSDLTATQYPDLGFQLRDGFASHLQALPFPAESEAQEASLPGPVYRALSCIHCEPQRVLDKARQTHHYPLACTATANVDLTVVRVAGKFQVAPFQLPIQFVQHHIGQHRRQWPTLRYALGCRGFAVIDLYTCLQVPVD